MEAEVRERFIKLEGLVNKLATCMQDFTDVAVKLEAQVNKRLEVKEQKQQEKTDGEEK